MRTFFVSLLIAALLIGGGLLFNSAMNNVSAELAEKNNTVLKNITAEDFALASAQADAMSNYVKEKYTLLATIVDHNLVDDIELCISELSGYTKREDRCEAQVRCMRLEKLIHHLKTNYSLTLQNIL